MSDEQIIDLDSMRVQMGKIVVPLNVLSNDQLHQLGNKLVSLMSNIIERNGLVRTTTLRDSFFFNIVNNQKEQYISLLTNVEYAKYVLNYEYGSFSTDSQIDPYGVMRQYFSEGTELVNDFIANSANIQTTENSFSVNNAAQTLGIYPNSITSMSRYA